LAGAAQALMPSLTETEVGECKTAGLDCSLGLTNCLNGDFRSFDVGKLELVSEIKSPEEVNKKMHYLISHRSHSLQINREHTKPQLVSKEGQRENVNHSMLFLWRGQTAAGGGLCHSVPQTTNKEHGDIYTGEFFINIALFFSNFRSSIRIVSIAKLVHRRIGRTRYVLVALARFD
jgi:hypothetical protein